MTTLCIICSVWRAHSTSCWLTSSGKRDLGWGGDGMTQQIKIFVNFGCTCWVFSPNHFIDKKNMMSSFSCSTTGLFCLELLNFQRPEEVCNESCGVGCSSISFSPMWLECTARQRRVERVGLCFFLCSAGVAAATPQGSLPLLSVLMCLPLLPRTIHWLCCPPPSPAFAIWSPLHEPQLSAVGS